MTALNKQALRSREEFEEYYNKTHAVKVTSQFKRFGYYVSPTMQKAWELWQKAQSSMRDELEAAEKRIAELQILAFNPALLDVIAERQRQRAVEGWTSEHDDAYQNSELADAAACYAIHAHNQGFSTPAHWPWSPDWWKQSGARRDLVKAGALILAEIERIDRAAGIGVKGE